MIVYQKTKAEFINDVRDDCLTDLVFEAVEAKLGRKTGDSEVNSWRNSSMYVNNVLSDPRIPESAGVALEYLIPSSNNRVDVIISGLDAYGATNIVIIELKQWITAEVTSMRGIVRSFVGGAKRELPHPSYQVATYAGLLNSFSSFVFENEIALRPCVYLHNYPVSDRAIVDPFYKEELDSAPLFRKSEGSKLADFISRYVRKGDRGEALFGIESGEIRPSKALADALLSMIRGNKVFTLIDEQKLVYEKVLYTARGEEADRNVIIVDGGPGTGKTVVAINLLVDAIDSGLVCHYVTRNSAPREVYRAKLTGSIRKTKIDVLFKSSGSYTESRPRELGLVIVDEAHRLNEKSGIFKNLGENQVKELIHASKTSVFFLDPNQRVTFDDIGSESEIEKWADYYNAKVTKLTLPSQFRCAGSDGYLSWIDSTLQIRDTANFRLDQTYDFRVFDDPEEMRKAICSLNQAGHNSRMLAGYCWKWISKANPTAYDITFAEYGFRMRWNDFNLGQSWIMHEEGAEQVGCIHTSQGLEAEYVGVIIGDDLKYERGELATYPQAHPSADKNFRGLKGRLKNPETREQTLAEAHKLILNTYRTLMTRGMRGCFVFCSDENLANYLRSRM